MIIFVDFLANIIVSLYLFVGLGYEYFVVYEYNVSSLVIGHAPRPAFIKEAHAHCALCLLPSPGSASRSPHRVRKVCVLIRFHVFDFMSALFISFVCVVIALWLFSLVVWSARARSLTHTLTG